MTSTLPQEEPKASRSLGDIRQTYAGDSVLQNYALQHHHPVDFSAKKAVNVVPGWEAKSFGDGEIQALDITIILLRHLFSFVASEHRQNDTNPFAKMIWAHLGAAMSREAQSLERARILMEFVSNSRTSTLAVDAHNLLENDAMWKTVWDMPAFRLWNPKIMACRVGDSRWVEAEFDPGTLLSRISQVPYTGSDDLGECISDQFGTRLVEQDGYKYHWQAASHVVVRVLYDTTKPNSQSKGFDDLREILVNPYQYKSTGQGGRARYDPTNRNRYTLVAVVRMMKRYEAGSKDLVRFYKGAGYYQPLPLTMQARLTMGNKEGKEWRLGEMGWKYMLFYVKTRGDPLPFRTKPTEFFDCSEIAATHRMARLICTPKETEKETGGSDGFLRTPPTAPRSMREAAEREQ
ncbi:hypothetical protein F4782DRAFT_522105 [Xylaria castorea]|nr:hypothetical protein F4782DRAFT_522105 [Xylaria castorea]